MEGNGSKLDSLVNNRTLIRRRVGDIVDRLDTDLTKDQAVGMLTTMLMLAEFKGRKDPLTGINNRGSFDEVIKELVVNPATQFSLVVFDIDGFKTFNDKYGHTTGDQVLKAVTGEIQRHLRPNDFFARYGGEEFCLILPIDKIEDLAAFCEKVRSSVELMGGFKSDGKEIPGITISIGAGTYNHKENYHQFFDKVDAKLQNVKDTGKNGYAILENNV